MLLVPNALQPTPHIAPSLVELGQHLLHRSPGTVSQWQQEGLYQALQLQRLTKQFYLTTAATPGIAGTQKQVLQIMCKRREKDLYFIGSHWDNSSHNLESFTLPCQSFEQLLHEYRWQQRAFQGMSWLLELHDDLPSAQVFQTCADNLCSDLGFLRLAYQRALARGQI